MEYFHVQHTLLAVSDKRKYIKNPYPGKKRKAWNKPTKLFPNKWKRKLVVFKMKIMNEIKPTLFFLMASIKSS